MARIAGAGCCLLDVIHPAVDFSSKEFQAAGSRASGDGGLTPGRLVFASDLEAFSGRDSQSLLAGLPGYGAGRADNIGGPSIVSLVHAAQMLAGEGSVVAYHGARGRDAPGERLEALMRRTPVDLGGYAALPGRTPSTLVLSDPSWDGGRGERCFVNELGVAADYGPAGLGEGLYGVDIAALGGTALVPGLHEALPALLAAAKAAGALTVVNTVYDFLNERRNPGAAWPLGPAAGLRGDPGPETAYRACDLLVMDRDEALRLAGARSLPEALRFLAGSGAGAFVVTRGGEPVLAWAGQGRRFAPLPLTLYPVIGLGQAREAAARAGFAADRPGDTTGCGDCFAGGIIAALARQLDAGRDGRLDLGEAVGWGVAAGAVTLLILGGTWLEEREGEKRNLVEAVHARWDGRGKEYADGR